jgi:hypothetical protein
MSLFLLSGKIESGADGDHKWRQLADIALSSAMVRSVDILFPTLLISLLSPFVCLFVSV